MSPLMMEITQMLKHSYRREDGTALDLTSQWKSPTYDELDSDSANLQLSQHLATLVDDVEEDADDDLAEYAFSH